MKKFMTLVVSIIITTTVNASNKSIENATDTPNKVSPFSVININVPARVRLIQGEEYGVFISTPNEYDTSMMDYYVNNGTLYISTSCSDILSASGRRTVITIITPADNAEIKIGDDVQPICRKN